MRPEIVGKTDIFITQEEYDKLYQLLYVAKRTPMMTKINSYGDLVNPNKKRELAYDEYEQYRISLSDKYSFELFRIDGSQMAIDLDLRIVYVTVVHSV